MQLLLFRGPLLWHFQNHNFINLPLTVTVTAGNKNTQTPLQRMNFRHIKVSVLCTAVKSLWTYGQECYTHVMWWAYIFLFPFYTQKKISFQADGRNFHSLSNLDQNMKESLRVSEHEKDKMRAGKRGTERNSGERLWVRHWQVVHNTEQSPPLSGPAYINWSWSSTSQPEAHGVG